VGIGERSPIDHFLLASLSRRAGLTRLTKKVWPVRTITRPGALSEGTKVERPKWKMIDTFSGIGGFSLAAEWTGRISPVQFIEIDPWCRRVLAKHWPEVPIHDDIRTFLADADSSNGNGRAESRDGWTG
jgi:hypothetical protein